jgi:TonB family protein
VLGESGVRFAGRWIVVLAVWVPGCVASVSASRPNVTPVLENERAAWPASFHHSAQGAILRGGAPTRCEDLRPAEALATPDPPLDRTEVKGKVAVSFVIGTDGRVHSPVVLESAGSDEDWNVLEAVRGWRYRPATCNAVPAETESRVEFSSR